MATIVQSTNINVSGIAVSLAAGDSFRLLQGVFVQSSGADAISASAGGVNMIIQGSIFAAGVGIRLEGGSGVDNVLITESGFLEGGITSARANSRFTNYGSISDVSGGGSACVFLNGAQSTFLNHGNVSTNDGDFANAAAVFATAAGVIVTNYGTISAPTPLNFAIAGGVDSQAIINRGTITGLVSLNSGADGYDGRGGRVDGAVSGGAGNDTLFGGLGADTLRGDADSDSIYFDAEDLSFGIVNGGTGYDTGYNTDNTTPITINLTTQGFEAYYGSAADELVFSGSLGGFGAFARFGAGNDTWDGSAQADNVDGGTGVDVLYGRAGADVIAGGNGGDWLSGGAGADTFDYNSLTESSASASDYIADFSTALGDKIDLSGVTFGLATFNSGYGVGTSVYIYAGGGGTTLVQVYSLATLDMQIVVNQASLAVGDFVL